MNEPTNPSIFEQFAAASRVAAKEAAKDAAREFGSDLAAKLRGTARQAVEYRRYAGRPGVVRLPDGTLEIPEVR